MDQRTKFLSYDLVLFVLKTIYVKCKELGSNVYHGTAMETPFWSSTSFGRLYDMAENANVARFGWYIRSYKRIYKRSVGTFDFIY